MLRTRTPASRPTRRNRSRLRDPSSPTSPTGLASLPTQGSRPTPASHHPPPAMAPGGGSRSSRPWSSQARHPGVGPLRQTAPVRPLNEPRTAAVPGGWRREPPRLCATVIARSWWSSRGSPARHHECPGEPTEAPSQCRHAHSEVVRSVTDRPCTEVQSGVGADLRGDAHRRAAMFPIHGSNAGFTDDNRRMLKAA
jgi:hypothetical protein